MNANGQTGDEMIYGKEESPSTVNAADGIMI